MRIRSLILFCLAATPVGAQDSTVTLFHRELINSVRLGEQRSLYIATPEGYDTSKERYPVLVILDANDRWQFALAIANVGFMASRSTIPGLIIVGIPNTSDRTHDLTPPAMGPSKRDFPTSGGVSAFADFLVNEVLPLVRAKYRTLPAAILAGHSFGGLTALEVASKHPGTFAGVIAMSPSLWWNDSTGIVYYSDLIAQEPKPQRLFVTSGSLEPDIDITTKRFEERLDSLKPVATTFGHQRYPDHTHGMTPAPSLVDGLRFVFAPVSLEKLEIGSLGPQSDSADVVKAVLDSKRVYADGARLFGLDERLPEKQLNRLGYSVLVELRNAPLAVWVFRQNAEMWPESANVYDSLGDGLLSAGDTNGAIEQFKHAVDVGLRNGNPVIGETQRKLIALQRGQSGPEK